MKITTTVEIPSQRIADLLVTLFESGASDWLGIVERPAGAPLGHEWYSSGGSLDRPDWHCFVDYDDPDGEEGRFTARKIVRLADLERALQKMATDWPKCFRDILDENDDAVTADIFGQLAVLGEVVYG